MLYLIAFALLICGCRAVTNDTADLLDVNGRLFEHLKQRTKPHSRPVMHPSICQEIHVASALYQIVDLDQRNNMATISAYFELWWIDQFLTWEPAEFGNTTNMFLPTELVWKPEIYLYHSIEGNTPIMAGGSAVEVQHNGKIRVFVPLISRALCPVNVKYFPFDTQSCSFQYGSWSYRKEHMLYIVETQEVFLGDFYDNQEWLLMEASLFNGTTIYENNESYSMVVMRLVLRRQSFYYVFNLVLPTTLVSLVAIIGFHVPANSSGRREGKYRLGIMTLLSMAVMLLMLVDEMPKFALESIPGQRGSFSDVPLLGLYYISLIFTISICSFTESMFVLLEKYAYEHPDIKYVPQCLLWLTKPRLFSVAKRSNQNNGQLLQNTASELQQDKPLIIGSAAPDLPENHHKTTEFNINQQNTVPPSATSTDKCLMDTELRTKINQTLDLLRRHIYAMEDERLKKRLRPHWNRLLNRLENVSLTVYLMQIAAIIFLFYLAEKWY